MRLFNEVTISFHEALFNHNIIVMLSWGYDSVLHKIYVKAIIPHSIKKPSAESG